MSAVTTDEIDPNEGEGQAPLPGLPPGPQFEGYPIARYIGEVKSLKVSLPGEPKIGDRGWARVYYRVDYPSFGPDDRAAKDSTGRVNQSNGITIIEWLPEEKQEDRFGNSIRYVDGQREVE